MKKHKIKNKRAALAVCACVLVIAIVGVYTLAKYASDNWVGGNITLEEFYAVARLYYEDENGARQEVTINPDSELRNSYIELTVKEFETLTVDIEYTGKAKTYCRFKLDLSWIQYVEDSGTGERTAELIPHKYPECTYDDIVYDNVAKDGWFYIKETLENDRTINAITGISPSEDLYDKINDSDQSEYVRVLATVDCVQYNRVSALWNMNSLPWWGS